MHLHPRLGDVQRAELGLDRGRQAGGGAAAGLVQLRRGLAAARIQLAGALAQGAQVFVGVLELLELEPHLRQLVGQLRDLDAVLAPQPFDRVQAIVGGLELAGLDLELVGEARGRPRGLLAGELRDRELLLDCAQLLRVVAATLGAIEPVRQSARDGVVGVVQRLVGLARELGPSLGVAQQRDAAAQGLVGLGVELDRLELVDREAQVVEVSLALGRTLLQLEQRALRRDPGGVAAAVLLEHRAELGPRVEPLEVARGVGEEVVLVLAADVDQLLADLGKHCLGHEAARDGGAAAAAAGHGAVHQQALVVVERGREAGAREHGRDALAAVRGQFERAVDLGALGALAHELGATAGAAEQRQRTHDDGLASAGLTGEHVEPTDQIERDVFEQREAADAQVQQHR
ncbi:MAG: hypothetical protein U0168_31115 [Nannocystaceae bacterium]